METIFVDCKVIMFFIQIDCLFQQISNFIACNMFTSIKLFFFIKKAFSIFIVNALPVVMGTIFTSRRFCNVSLCFLLCFCGETEHEPARLTSSAY